MKDEIERKRNGLSEAIGDEWIKKERKKRRRVKKVRSESGSGWIVQEKAWLRNKIREKERGNWAEEEKKKKEKKEGEKKRKKREESYLENLRAIPVRKIFV